MMQNKKKLRYWHMFKQLQDTYHLMLLNGKISIVRHIEYNDKLLSFWKDIIGNGKPIQEQLIALRNETNRK